MLEAWGGLGESKPAWFNVAFALQQTPPSRSACRSCVLWERSPRLGAFGVTASPNQRSYVEPLPQVEACTGLPNRDPRIVLNEGRTREFRPMEGWHRPRRIVWSRLSCRGDCLDRSESRSTVCAVWTENPSQAVHSPYPVSSLRELRIGATKVPKRLGTPGRRFERFRPNRDRERQWAVAVSIGTSRHRLR